MRLAVGIALFIAYFPILRHSKERPFPTVAQLRNAFNRKETRDRGANNPPGGGL